MQFRDLKKQYEVLKNDTFLNKIPKKYREPLMEITALYRG